MIKGSAQCRESCELFWIANGWQLIKMDGVIVAVAHDEFKKMGLKDIGKFMNEKPVLIDVRVMFDEEAAKGKGFIIDVCNL